MRQTELGRRATRVFAILLPALAALALLLPATADAAGCSQVRNGLRSLDGTVPAAITFINGSTFPIRLEWADYKGQLKEYATIEPGNSLRQQTFISHPWVATSPVGDCLAVYLPRPGETKVVMQFAMPDDGEEDQAAPPPGSGADLGGGVEGRSFGGVVRAGPGMQFPKIASLAEGDGLVLEADTGIDMGSYHWFAISFGGRKGFMWGGILCAHSEISFVLEICR